MACSNKILAYQMCLLAYSPPFGTSGLLRMSLIFSKSRGINFFLFISTEASSPLKSEISMG